MKRYRSSIAALMLLLAATLPFAVQAEEVPPFYGPRETWEVTAYACPPHCGRTASGVQVALGHLAAPQWVPFGTRLHVEGYGVGVVTDRGGAIRGNRLDVFTATPWEALLWGRRWVRVWWLPDVAPAVPETPAEGEG